MRYFKWSQKPGYVVWAVRPDGYERCIRSIVAPDEHTNWHKPKDLDEKTILEYFEDHSDEITEITEEQAFLEMI